MNDTKSRSFWSSIPGLVTGLAGVLTAVVGLVTVLIQLDVIGGDDSSNDTTTSSTRPGASATPSGGGSGGTSGQGGRSTPKFAVSPTSVKLDTLLAKEATVTVSNTGSTALSVEAPELDGPGAAEFSVDAQACTTATVAVGRKCAIKVTYAPSARGEHSATLQVNVAGASDPEEVQLSGSRPL